MAQREYFLRPLKAEDAARMLEWLQNADVICYLRLDGQNKTQDDTREFIEQAADESKNLHRAVTARDGQYYGTVSLKNIDSESGTAEYAIALHPDAIGTGAAKSATDGILEVAFQALHLKRVYLNVIRENQRAIRFYEKYGFHHLDAEPITFKGHDTLLDWYEMYAPGSSEEKEAE